MPAQALETVEHSAASGKTVADATWSTELAGVVSDAFTHGMTASLWVAAGISLVCAAISLLFIRKGADQSAEPENVSEIR